MQIVSLKKQKLPGYLIRIFQQIHEERIIELQYQCNLNELRNKVLDINDFY